MEETAEQKAEREAIEKAKNNATTATVVDNTAEINELRKQKEQAEMRARQLENEKAAREKSDEEARQKELEEQNEFKTLYEREKEQRESLEREREEGAKRSAIETAKSAILSSYSAEVTEVAEAAGLTLLDDSESAKADLKKRLDVIAGKLPSATPLKRVQGNNGVTVQPTGNEADDAKLYERMRYSDRNISDAARSAAIKKIPALDVMRRNAGLSTE